MKHTRRILAVLVLSLFALSGLAAETAIDQLYGVRQYELADAYWAAGQRFADLGQADRAAQFKAAALRLFPGYVPGQPPSVQTLKAPEPAPTVPEVSVVKERNLQGEKITRLQFQKLLRGFLTGSAKTVAAVLGDRIEVQGQAAEPSINAVAAFLEAHPTEAGSPDELFLVDTLEVAEGAEQTVLVTVEANPEAPGDLGTLLSFWKPQQVYTFDRAADTWKLVKIEGL